MWQLNSAWLRRSRAEPHRWSNAHPHAAPIVVSRRTARGALLLCLALTLLLLYMVPSVVGVLLGGAALALVLWYPVRWLSRVVPQRIAILIAFLLLLLFIALSLFLLVPPLVREAVVLGERIPELADLADARVRDALIPLERAGLLPEGADETIRKLQGALAHRTTVVTEHLARETVDVFSNALWLTVQVFGILFVAVYMLADARRLRVRSIRRTPRKYRADVAELWDAVEETLSRYLAGMVLVSVVQGVLVGVALWLLDIPYALLLAIWVTITSVIPYLGSWLGAIPILVLAFLMSWVVGVAIWAWYFIVQTVVGNLLTPRVQGEAVRVHPVLVLLGVIAAGKLFGPLGVLLAAPVMGVGRVFFDFVIARVQVAD